MNLKIRAMYDKDGEPIRYATLGVTFTTDPCHRKLEPGEVMETPDDYDISKLRHLVEITDEPATRPFLFENESEAKFTSPSFRLRFESDAGDVEKHKAAVAKRMAPRRGRPPKAA